MKTLKITMDNKISIIDVDFKDLLGKTVYLHRTIARWKQLRAIIQFCQ